MLLVPCLGWALLIGVRLSDHAPVMGALSSNDHLRKQPLVEALQQGCVAVEVEVTLSDGALVLATKQSEKPLFVVSYLEPLVSRMRSRQGRVWSGGPTFTLFVKTKLPIKEVGLSLERCLDPYSELLTDLKDGVRNEKGLTVVLQVGNSKAFGSKLFFCEGRPEDLVQVDAERSKLYIADNWLLQVRWLGIGRFDSVRRQQFLDSVVRAHTQGRIIRYWGTPDNPAVWNNLIDARVDFIGSENLGALTDFLERHPMKVRQTVPGKNDGGGGTRMVHNGDNGLFVGRSMGRRE